MDFDTSWCPVCDRQILPKRFLVPVPPTTPPAPAPPPSSPQSSPLKTNSTNVRRSKLGTIRARTGGLVQGTGRVKPNGTLKRADSGSKNQSATPPPPTKPSAPIKHRTVIDQGPIPLYCSDECQMADINNIHGALPIDYNPDRASLPRAPVPRKAFSGTSSETESDSTGSSIESHSSLSSPPQQTHMSPSIAVLSAMYHFPPLPPPVPTFTDDAASSSDSDYPHEYTSGIMMAGKLIQSMCPKPAKRSSYGQQYSNPQEGRKPIPGWTDGSNAWRSAVYSFSSPKDTDRIVDSSSQHDDNNNTRKAYKGFAASPHRSRGVYSTLGDSTVPSPTTRSATSAASLPSSETEDLVNKFSQTFSRRCESRSSLFAPSSPTSSSTASFAGTSPRRERSLLQPGAEGRLLVPDVKMRVHGGASSASLSSSYPATASSRTSVRSPLGYGSDDDDQTCVSARLEQPKRPVVETRSWSYDNLKTYPVMQLPPKKEKRVQKKMVDGVEVDYEVEVEVVEPMKRLFLFPGRETVRAR